MLHTIPESHLGHRTDTESRATTTTQTPAKRQTTARRKPVRVPNRNMRTLQPKRSITKANVSRKPGIFKVIQYLEISLAIIAYGLTIMDHGPTVMSHFIT